MAGSWTHQIITPRSGKLKEIFCYFGADHMRSGVCWSCFARPVPVEIGHGRCTTGLKIFPENILRIFHENMLLRFKYLRISPKINLEYLLIDRPQHSSS